MKVAGLRTLRNPKLSHLLPNQAFGLFVLALWCYTVVVLNHNGYVNDWWVAAGRDLSLGGCVQNVEESLGETAQDLVRSAGLDQPAAEQDIAVDIDEVFHAEAPEKEEVETRSGNEFHHERAIAVDIDEVFHAEAPEKEEVKPVPATSFITSEPGSALHAEAPEKEEVKPVPATSLITSELGSALPASGEGSTAETASTDFTKIDDFSMLSQRIPVCAAQLPPAKTFLMVMSSHTGSTALMSILGQHPDVYMELDQFEPLNVPKYTENITAAVEFTREYFTKARESGKVAGFKLSGYPIMRAQEEFAEIVKEFDTRVIWNYRTDFFKRAVGRYPMYFLGDDSAVSGISLSELNKRCEMGVGCNYTIESIEDLHCTMTRGVRVHMGMEESVNSITSQALGGCALHIPYHDFLHHPIEVSMQMQDFLGLPRHHVESTRAKATSDNICSVVNNYADICAAFNECSAWRNMLNDEENGCSCENYKYESLGGDGENKFCTMTADPKGRRWCGTWSKGT
eukprot:CAMPEP_0198736778 /NCGR_PEP_ID=MMETSP1475-20131203/67530_1 /TAXON_ID= ORGANISM="Unidentified sp., Strain CCMP1999" /NCGR_SAMPLE_ID=MMETSP1475 /ASSEMBLY_ACC=CAM_ASM_001111 /LENGTH=512 /DNA_ID=CAMNT_0044500629 /DNA_START=16 /DNA_END=1553 /DNA_ORIENTATION=-